MRHAEDRHWRRKACVLLVGTLAILAFGAGQAAASSIVYIGADGNVHLTSPDGSVNHQVTTDGTAGDQSGDGYRSPSQTDAGAVVAIRNPDSSNTGFAYFFDRQSGALVDNWILPKSGTGSFSPAFGGQISPEGGAFVYDWGYIDCFGGCTTDFRVSVIFGPGQTDPCLFACHNASFRPRWIPGTSYAGFIDKQFSGITVQTATGPQFWFGFNDAYTRSFDVEGDRTLVELDYGAATYDLALVQNNGTPPTANPQVLCTMTDFFGQSPRFSPGGSMIAWQGPEGIYVSPTPTETGGGTCTLQPKLVAAGGTRPDWGPVDVPAAPLPPLPDGDDGDDGDDGTQSAACVKAKKKVKAAKKKLKNAETPQQKEKAKANLKKVKKKAKKACA